MWTRKELKERGRFTMNANYWKTVLIALLLAVLVGGTSGSGGAAGGVGSGLTSKYSQETKEEELPAGIPEEFNNPDLEQFFEHNMPTIPAAAVVAIIVIVLLIVLVIAAIVIALDILIMNPLEVGCRRFSLQNLNRPAQVAETGFAFDHNYKNMISIMFHRDLYTFLWSLLFVIPGIVKAYEYRMIPYLLAEYPEMSKEEAFRRSRELMTGQKWKTFILDLSFIGWDILSVFTFGLLGIFYVQPYKMQTSAALYEALAYRPAAYDIMNEEQPQITGGEA